MAKTPFYKIIVTETGRDLSHVISKISYEDTVMADNLLTIHINNVDKNLIDNEALKEGTILSFQWGFLKGKTSKNFVARISDIDASYAEIINIVIRAGDLGIVLKKGGSKKVWKNITSSGIVKAIAAANGLKAVVTPTTKVHLSMPQGGKSNYDFIKHLVSIEKDGSFRFYLRNDEIHFTRIQLEKQSFKTLTWNEGNGIVNKFKPYSRENLKKAESRNTIITTVDPFTNETIQNVVTNDSSKDDVRLGEYVFDFNANQLEFRKQLQGTKSSSLNVTGKPSQVQANQNDPNNSAFHLPDPSGDKSEGSNIGNNIKKKEALFDFGADLIIEGDPDYIADEIITMSGTAKKDSGNWYVMGATHIIDSESSYTVRMQLGKNAGKKPIGNKTIRTNVNKTVGPDQKKEAVVKKEIPVIYFNEDAVIVEPN